MKGSGYEVVSAANGAEALEKLRSEGADMIVSDILMPVMDGFKLCKEVRADNTLKDIPLVFYTATYKDARDEELALKLGADRYLIKPMEPNKLLKILQEVMRDTEKGKVVPKKPVSEEKEEEVFKLYSERLVSKLEKKMLELEKEVTERKLAEEKIKHLNLMLRAIRKVNQLIVVEKDPIRLLQGVCDNLIENRGYNSVWIAILDESGKLVNSAEAGLGKEFMPLEERLKSGDLPYCGRKTLSKSGVVVIKDPSSSCTGCPLSEKFHDAVAMSIRLEYEEKVYGMLVVSIPAGFVIDEEEQSLFVEVAGDIAFALHDMEIEEERNQAEEKFSKAFISSPDPVTITSMQTGRLIEVNDGFEQLLGFGRAEAIGKTTIDLELWADSGDRDTVISILKSERRLRNHITKLRTKSGKIIDCELSMELIEISGEQCLLAITRDITDRKQAEESLRWELNVNTSLAELSNALITPSSTIKSITEIVLNSAKFLTNSKHGYVGSIDPKTAELVTHTITKMMGKECKVSDKDKRIVFTSGQDGR